MLAIDGSKFKAVNSRDRNFTRAKVKRRIEQIEASVARYLSELESADRQRRSDITEARTTRLRDKIDTLQLEMQRMQTTAKVVEAAPDHQISLTDPDARSMATSGKGSGMVGHNVQSTIDAEHHLIVDHEVANVGHDRSQLKPMADRARSVMQTSTLAVATLTANRSWPARGPVSRFMCPSRRPPTARPEASSASATSSMNRTAIRIVARRFRR